MNAGVILIGSLFWDKHRNGFRDIRKNWRKNFLDFQNAFRVRLPIRYGRKSTGDIFTMVFSTSLERSRNLGIAYVAPFKSNPINKYEQLEIEALEFDRPTGLGQTVPRSNHRSAW